MKVSKGQKKIIIFGTVFAIGFGLCFLLIQGGLWNAQICGLPQENEVCVPTCLTVHAQDETTGVAIEGVTVVLYWSNGTYLAGGVTDANGDWILNLNYFGCGGEGLTLNWTYAGIQGSVIGTQTIPNTESLCSRDSTTGCCIVIVEVE